MNYSIADFILHTEGAHNNIVECGLNCFKPFEIEGECTAEPTMTLIMDCPIDEAAYPVTKVIHDFEFEQNYATGELARFADGYRFAIKRQDKTFLYIKKDGSNIVESNLGLAGEVEPGLLRFGLWIMFGIVIAPLGAIAIHSSVVVKEHEAVLCLGESGPGKSTHTRLWRENIEGAHLLNDDSPILRVVDGTPYAYGSPWSGKTPCYKNKRLPLAGLVRLSQAPHNKIKRVNTLLAIGALLPSCPHILATDDALQDEICTTLSQVIATTPVYRLECLPDAEAAALSCKTLFAK